MAAEAIEQLLQEHQRSVLLIGEQLAFLKQEWEAGPGADLKPATKRRRWAAFLYGCHFQNPDPFSAWDWIAPSDAEKLIQGFQRHLLSVHIHKTAKAKED